MDDKAEIFAKSLFGEIFESYCKVMKLDIEFQTEKGDKRIVLEQFFYELLTFSRPFIDKLIRDMADMPVLLFSCDAFFKQCTTSVCLKLIAHDDPEVAFLKVMGFLILLTASSFLHRCYRPIQDMPSILHKLLKDHIKTKFYEKNRFDDILQQCRELKDEKWYASTVEEIRGYMKNVVDTELPAFQSSHGQFDLDKFKMAIKKASSRKNPIKSEPECCKICGTKCIFFLRAFLGTKGCVQKP